MNTETGQTITEVFISTDAYNNPIVPATFDGIILKDGLEYTDISLFINTSDSARGIYEYSITPFETGDYQVYINNITTNVIYVSEIFIVTNTLSTIYIGL